MYRPAGRQTIRHTQGKCGLCGGTNLKAVKIVSTMKTDVLPTPKVTTTCHITKTCKCLYCGEMAKAGMVNVTSLGPNLFTEASALWEKNTKDIENFLKR